MSSWRAVVLAALALAITTFAFESTHWDLAVQDRCYDFEQGRWLITGDTWWLKMIFYRGLKGAIIVFGSLLLITALLPDRA
ncbi:MAG: hypothetical protein KDB53_14410, partial [Planctomycetes bacterium]|nr:hypothetical protein [Planctomycetota bacterium]